ncbi:alpha/beta hydrolase family protein [Sphingomonas edaphi]|uniref:Dienelactone hydrolase n=1 Tax=Sphingomonas edaphi TaxID=2315689 RepID=A0A418PY19_9SPHN|nr:CocE/NonD family hydrolase [Sphingomonas edaphi]RIX27100.1 dienelactone hydrolase [Sphingomonas edaphi]
MNTITSILAGLFLGALAIAPSFAWTPDATASSISVSQAVVEDAGHARIPVVIWAPATGEKLPLIVMSHGTGAGPLAHVDTAQALADAGFVVVAPMHPGDNFQEDVSVGKHQWFVDRSRHVSKVLDYMLGQWDGRMRLAPSRVGMFGMSAGATTALISAGGKLDLASVDEHCKKQPEFVCKIMTPAAPETTPPPFVREPRIVAEVIVAPGLSFAFEPNGLSDVKIPVQLWSGSSDETVPYATNSGVIRKLLKGQVEFHSVENAVHLSFLAPCTPESPPFICKDNPGFDRSAFHQTFNRNVVSFFRAHLRGPSSGGK